MRYDNYVILIVLCLIVLASHLFDIASKRLKLPSVLLLLGLGIALRSISGYFNVVIDFADGLTGFLGIIGLILIVLEGSLDLKLGRRNYGLVKNSFSSALFILLISSFSVAAVLSYWLGIDFKRAFVNAIPLAVISSAIVIPTVHVMSHHKKEFMVYEAIFSDILGIILFNFVIQDNWSHAGSIAGLFFGSILLLIISAAFSFLLLIFISKIRIPAKFYIIIAILVLVYCLGKLLHLSSLLLILSFGLLINNLDAFAHKKYFKAIDFSVIAEELKNFRLIVAESAFLIRTFFFVLFGYSIDLFSVLNAKVALLGVAIVAVLLMVRFFYLKYLAGAHLFPELFIAPRGLVTILLFYSIPGSLAIDSFGKGEVFFVVILTSVIMLFAFSGKRNINKLEYL